MYKGLSEAAANAIYDVLVKHAGAREDRDSRQDFVFYMVRDHDFTIEYCFGGSLGHGGKFYRALNNPYRLHKDARDLTEQWYVTCYSEDFDQERQAAINATDAALIEVNLQMGPRG